VADITNTQAVQFTQSMARPTSNAIALAYWMSKKLLAEWYGNDLVSVIPNTADAVVDGNAKPITGAKVTNIVTRAGELVADLEANSNAKLNTILTATTVGG
jgi:hypothetical protein